MTTSMSIQEMTMRAVEVPLARPVRTSSGNIETAPLVLVDLQADQGPVGRAYVFAYTPTALGALARLIADLAPVVKGQPLAPEDLDATLQRHFRLLGGQGLTAIASAAIDMAAWDALAKAYDLPLVELLGGRRVEMPAYASVGLETPEDAARLATEAAVAGFEAVKVKIGRARLEDDLDVIGAVRSAVGPKVGVMVDYNQCLSVPEAIRRGVRLDDEGLAWIEEPTRYHDFAGHAAICHEVRTPIQLGENWWGPADMYKSVQAGASDLAMLDLMKIGGITGWRRAAALAEAAGLPVSSHIFPEISAHLLAVTPTAQYLEYLDLAAPVLREPLEIQRGRAVIPARPGHGLEWDESAVKRYLKN